MLRRLAPAKLNLYLRILGRRPDGYHELETLFERVDLADVLTFEPADDLALACDDPTLPTGPENLILRAAALLRRHAGTTRGARIRLAKRIPVAAGLGGGSSDAATTLRALNELWELQLPIDTLTALAAQVGADVPVFLGPEPVAIGRGRGDICEPVPDTPPLSHVLVVPPVPLSTREVFAQAQIDLTAPRPSLTMVMHALRNGSLRELAEGLWNDLEPEAIRRCPSSGLILSHLRDAGCLGVCLSGSGPSVFGVCQDLPTAQAVASTLRDLVAPSWRVEVVQTEGAEPNHHRPATRTTNVGGGE